MILVHFPLCWAVHDTSYKKNTKKNTKNHKKVVPQKPAVTSQELIFKDNVWTHLSKKDKKVKNT